MLQRQSNGRLLCCLLLLLLRLLRHRRLLFGCSSLLELLWLLSFSRTSITGKQALHELGWRRWAACERRTGQKGSRGGRDGLTCTLMQPEL